MDSIAELKKKQRAAGIAARMALPESEAAQLDSAICARLAAHQFYKDASVILTYKPFKGEADISAFNELGEATGKTVAYPICYDDGKMIAAVPDDPDGMVKGRYGIFAPAEGSSHILSPEDIDLVIVPCTAFDGESKLRIGMGAGYYDRFLPGCPNAMRLAVAYEVQHIKGIRREPWDAAMHAIITESVCYY